jgi:hypothetical protein
MFMKGNVKLEELSPKISSRKLPTLNQKIKVALFLTFS